MSSTCVIFGSSKAPVTKENKGNVAVGYIYTNAKSQSSCENSILHLWDTRVIANIAILILVKKRRQTGIVHNREG